MSHAEKPKPVAFYWEFWGDTICSNNNWEVQAVRVGIPIYTPCPDLPFGDFLGIIDGKLSFVWTNTGPSGKTVTILRWNDATANPLGAQSLAKFKCAVQCTDPGATTGKLSIMFYDSGWTLAQEEITSDDGETLFQLDVSSLSEITQILFRIRVGSGETIAFQSNYLTWQA